MVYNYLRLLRPKQWIKNLFVFAPIIFSKHLLEFSFLLNSTIAFISFCFISSTIYIINDIFDRDNDRIHPVKKNRPIASGMISISNSIIIATVLFCISTFLFVFLKSYFLLIILLYFLINLFYTIWFKHIVILDVFSIASGFMLRVIGGAIVIGVAASYWLIICTLFVSLFLGFAKRRSEMILNQNNSDMITRKVLDDYSISFIDQMLTITASGMAISYSLYTVSDRTIILFQTEKLIYTTVFVLYGIFRYLYLLMKKNMGEDTSQIVIKDIPMLINIFLWLISCVLLLYYPRIF